MRRLIVAIRAFFRTLCSGEVAIRVEAALAREASPPAASTEPPKAEAKKPAQPGRSDAITLLAALQREARFVDFIQESLAEFSDAQIGSVVRDVHRECGKALERWFALAPLDPREQGTTVDVPAGFDPARCRLVGAVMGEPPFSGVLVHHGWEATKCDLPSWSGRPESVRAIAPAEVEMKAP
jgi:hypothetical protein